MAWISYERLSRAFDVFDSASLNKSGRPYLCFHYRLAPYAERPEIPHFRLQTDDDGVELLIEPDDCIKIDRDDRRWAKADLVSNLRRVRAQRADGDPGNYKVVGWLTAELRLRLPQFPCSYRDLWEGLADYDGPSRRARSRV